MPSKQQQIATHLLNTRNFALIPPTPAQVQAFNTVSQATYSHLRHCTQLLGTIQGYYIMQGTISLCAAKVYRYGNSHSVPLYLSTIANAPLAIAMQMAYNTLARSANMGVWQRQLPTHLLTPRQQQVLGRVG